MKKYKDAAHFTHSETKANGAVTFVNISHRSVRRCERFKDLAVRNKYSGSEVIYNTSDHNALSPTNLITPPNKMEPKAQSNSVSVKWRAQSIW